MGAPGWLEVANDTASVVGAVAGVIGIWLTWRGLRGSANVTSPTSPVDSSRRWLWLGAVLGLVAIVAGGLRLGGVTPGVGGWPVPVAALVGGIAVTVVYVVVHRRAPLLADPRLRGLMAAQRDAAIHHRYDFFDGFAPALPKIYVEQMGEVADERVPRGTAPSTVAERVTVRRMLDDSTNVVVVSDPGTGKSTLIAHVLHAQCQWWLDARRRDRLADAPLGPIMPVALAAPRMVDRGPIDALAEARSGDMPAAQWRDLFGRAPRAGCRWLVMVDGLDEVLSARERARLLTTLAAWLDRVDSPHRFLVTTRPLFLGELSEIRGRAVSEYRLARFGRSELEVFARQWFTQRAAERHGVAGDAVATSELFLERVAASRLQTIVEVPLLATIAVLVFENDQASALPTSRAELYDRVVRQLLFGRQAMAQQHARVRAEFERYGHAGTQAWAWLADALVDLIEHLADTQLTPRAPAMADTIRAWVLAEAPPRSIARVPGWERHVHALLTATGLLIALEGGLTFTHRSIAEYLAAGPRGHRFDEAAWFEEVRRPDTRNLALFVLARRPVPADDLVRELLNSLGDDVVIAGEILVDGVDVAGPLRQQVIAALVGQFTADDPTASGALRVLVDLLGDPHVVASLAAVVADTETDPWVRVLAADALVRSDNGTRSLRRLAVDTSFDADARQWAVQRLAGPGGARDTRLKTDLRAGTVMSARLHAYRRVLDDPQAEAGFLVRAAIELADHRDDAGIDMLWRCAIDGRHRPVLRLQAARALLRTGGDRYRDRVRAVASDAARGPDTRVPLAAALAEARDDVGRAALAELAGADPDLAGRLPAVAVVLGAAAQLPDRSRELIWGGNVPVRNRSFTGRAAELDALHESLATRQVATVVSRPLSGLGGVGKTELAVEFVYRHIDEYDLVWWITADNIDGVRTSLGALGRRLGRPPAEDLDAAARDALEALDTSSRWLLVYDNVDRVEDLAPYLPGVTGHVIITSRKQPEISGSPRVILDTFNREDSVRLLTTRAGISHDDADRIADRLGDLPIALEQAAAWISATGMPTDEYIALLTADTTEPLASNFPTTVAATWTLAADRLRTDSPDGHALLLVCARLGLEPIAFGMLQAGATGVTGPIGEVLRDPLRFARAVRDVGRMALMQVDTVSNTLRVHRLVQAVINGAVTEAESTAAVDAARRILIAADPGAPDDSTAWPRYAEIAGHADAVDLANSTLAGARDAVLNQIRFHYATGNITASRDLAERAMTAWPANDKPTLWAKHRWAAAIRALGEIAPASRADEDVWIRSRTLFGDGDDLALDAAAGLAAGRRSLGHFEEARALDQDTLDGCRRLYGDNDAKTIQVRRNLAVDLRLLGQVEAALKIDEDVLARARNAFGNEAAFTLVTVHHVVWDHFATGAYAQAQAMHEPNLATLRTVLGDHHPQVRDAHRMTALLRRRLGRYADARGDAARHADMIDPWLPDDHELVLAAGMTLANAQRDVRELDGAVRSGEKLLARYRHSLGVDHPFALAAAVNVAAIRRASGNLAGARALSEPTLDSLICVLGRDHPDTLDAAVGAATDRSLADDHAAARTLSADTFARSTRVRGERHPSTLMCAVNLALDLAATGDHTEAAAIRGAAIDRLIEVLGPQHPHITAAQAGERLTADIEPPPTW